MDGEIVAADERLPIADLPIADLVERTCALPIRKSAIGNPLHTSSVRYRSSSVVKSSVATVFARAGARRRG